MKRILAALALLGLAMLDELEARPAADGRSPPVLRLAGGAAAGGGGCGGSGDAVNGGNGFAIIVSW